MHHLHLLNSVRDQVQARLATLGAEDTPPEETILIREGMYCGRRFSIDDFTAVWFIEEGELKFYDQDGTVACVERAGSEQKQAA